MRLHDWPLVDPVRDLPEEDARACVRPANLLGTHVPAEQGDLQDQVRLHRLRGGMQSLVTRQVVVEAPPPRVAQAQVPGEVAEEAVIRTRGEGEADHPHAQINAQLAHPKDATHGHVLVRVDPHAQERGSVRFAPGAVRRREERVTQSVQRVPSMAEFFPQAPDAAAPAEGPLDVHVPVRREADVEPRLGRDGSERGDRGARAGRKRREERVRGLHAGDNGPARVRFEAAVPVRRPVPAPRPHSAICPIFPLRSA